MPTYVKTGFWDKVIGNNPQQAKAPKGWLNLDQFVQTLIPPTPPSTNIYNSNGTLTGQRVLDGNGNDLFFYNLSQFLTRNSSFQPSGIRLDFVNDIYQIGKISGGNRMSIIIDDTNQFIKTIYQNNDIGLKLDFANRTYQLGQITGNNATTLKIDDAAAFPVQVSGTNVTQNTSGAASGQFLKIKVGGVDYVIELKNPS